MKSQTSGAPETPIIALLFRTDLHKELETAIQKILILQDKHLPHAQGDEWFLTNPSDVTTIVASINYAELIYPVFDLSSVFET